MDEKQDLRKTLEDILVDLRNHTALTDVLEAANAVDDASNAIRLMHETADPFEPVEGEPFDVVVVIGAVTETSMPRNAGKTRTWRVQVDIGAKLDWRKDTDAESGTYAILELAEMMGLIEDRLGLASGISAAAPQGSDGTTGAAIPIEDDDDGTLTMTRDWIVSKTQIHRSH